MFLKDLDKLLSASKRNTDDANIEEINKNIAKLRNILNDIDDILRKHDLEHFAYVTSCHNTSSHCTRSRDLPTLPLLSFTTDWDSERCKYKSTGRERAGSNMDKLCSLLNDTRLGSTDIDSSFTRILTGGRYTKVDDAVTPASLYKSVAKGSTFSCPEPFFRVESAAKVVPILPASFRKETTTHYNKSNSNNNNNNDNDRYKDSQPGPSTSSVPPHEVETELFTPNPIIYYPAHRAENSSKSQNTTKKE